MLSVKTGTQSWSATPQKVDFDPEKSNSLSSSEQKNFFADQNIGDVLNKAADPNWVDPSKQIRKVGDNQLDKDAFMKLLLTQMKHQDPTNPLQSHEMAAQLAQFSSLEKLTNINDGINSLTKAQAPSRNFEALSLIGKAVDGDSAKIDRTDETDEHGIAFTLPSEALNLKVNIKDSNGKVIRTLDMAQLKSGKNEITWNGKEDDGRSAPKGTYMAELEAHGSNGQKIFANTRFQGVISGVNFTPQGPVLMMGKQSVALKDVKEIVDPRSMIKEEKVAQAQEAKATLGSEPTLIKKN